MDLEDALERSGVLDGPARCGAPAKTTGKTCRNRPLPGGKRCKFHGGKQSNKPQALTTKHGLASQYVKVADLPEILERVAQLRTAAGKEDALLTGAALTEKRLAAVPDKVEFLDAFVMARKSIREDLKTSHELTDAAPAGNTTYVVANFDPAKQAPFLARGLDGTIKIRLLDGAPYMLDEATGGWMPALEHTDEESQAKYFTRLLEAAPPK